jgi:hypothetical protein
VSWFVGVGFIVVASATLGPVLATDAGPIGRLVRGPDDALLRPGAPQSVPPIGKTTTSRRGSPWRPAPTEPVRAPLRGQTPGP